jgi:hypothetical protein
MPGDVRIRLVMASAQPAGHSQGGEGLQREWRQRERPSRHTQQGQRVVVARGAVEMQLLARSASMNKHPFPITADGNGDGLHQRPAVGGSVTRGVIEVPAPQAMRAVVAMRRPRRIA